MPGCTWWTRALETAQRHCHKDQTSPQRNLEPMWSPLEKLGQRHGKEVVLALMLPFTRLHHTGALMSWKPERREHERHKSALEAEEKSSSV